MLYREKYRADKKLASIRSGLEKEESFEGKSMDEDLNKKEMYENVLLRFFGDEAEPYIARGEVFSGLAEAALQFPVPASHNEKHLAKVRDYLKKVQSGSLMVVSGTVSETYFLQCVIESVTGYSSLSGSENIYADLISVAGMYGDFGAKYSLCCEYGRRQKSAVVAGSFDPFTEGHLHIVRQAAELFKSVDVVIFSNSKKNRKYDAEYMTLAIADVLNREGLKNCRSVYVGQKLLARYCMENHIEYSVRGLRNNMDFDYEETVARANSLVFPEIKTIYVRAENDAVSSSLIRELVSYGEDVSAYVPEEIFNIMQDASQTDSAMHAVE